VVTISLHLADLLRGDSDAGLIRGGYDGCGIEEERLACLDGETGCACGVHGADGCEADDGNVEAHVLIGFGYFDDGEGAAQGGGKVGIGDYIEGAEEVAGARDGGVGAFHGFDGDAGLSGDDDGLAEVVGGDGVGDGAAVCDVLLLFFIRCPVGEDAGFCEEGFEVLRGGDEFDAFVVEDLGDCTEEHVGVAGAQVEEEFGQAPVGADAGEDLLVLDLAGHDGVRDTFGMKGFNEAGELSEGEPVDVDVGVGCGSGVDLGVSLFVDGGDDYGEIVGPCCVEEEEGEAAIASDQA